MRKSRVAVALLTPALICSMSGYPALGAEGSIVVGSISESDGVEQVDESGDAGVQYDPMSYPMPDEAYPSEDGYYEEESTPVWEPGQDEGDSLEMDEGDELTDDELDDSDVVRTQEEKREKTPVAEPEQPPVEQTEPEDEKEEPVVKYRVHMQKKGWMREVSGGKVAGMPGNSVRVEAIKVRIAGLPSSQGGVAYRAYVQGTGWLKWARNGKTGGTTNKGLRVEALQLKTYGLFAKSYDVWYRVYTQGIGWLAWTKNGKRAGTTNGSRCIEAIQVRVAPKGSRPNDLDESDVSYAYKKITKTSKKAIRIAAYMQDSGWQKAVSNGGIVGVTGESGSPKQLEAFRIKLSKAAYNKGLRYRAYVAKSGWQRWRKGGKVAGKPGKHIEAVQIKLSGRAAENFDVYYRSYMQGAGWTPWAKNGEKAGAEGKSPRVEALQVELVTKGDQPE